MVGPIDHFSLLQFSGAAIFAKDKQSRMVVANPACLNLLGKSWSQLEGRNDLEWHLDRVQARAVLANDCEVVESVRTQEYEEPFDTPRGSRIILSTKAPLLGKDGDVIGIVGVAKDITERKQREEQAAESKHRLKNWFAVVQAIARRTLTPGHGLRRFEESLLAYARAQDLVEKANGGVHLRDLISVQLHAFNLSGRIKIRGNDTVLMPNFAGEVANALHELVTNSLKHGALASDGEVSLTWTLQTQDHGQFIELIWTEDYDGDAAGPAHRGYGHLVLTQIIPRHLQGTASFEFGSGKLSWRVRARLPPSP